jgi:predicted site-specific integrase-resolvase
MNTKLLNTAEAAKYLGIAYQTLCNWRFYRKGPAYIRMGGRRILYRIEDLEHFVTSNRIAPCQDVRDLS